MSPWGLESSQPAKCQSGSPGGPAAPIKRLRRREGREDAANHGLAHMYPSEPELLASAATHQPHREKGARNNISGAEYSGLVQRVVLAFRPISNYNILRKSDNQTNLHLVKW